MFIIDMPRRENNDLCQAILIMNSDVIDEVTEMLFYKAS